MKKTNKKSAKAKPAAGAAEIRKAQKELKEGKGKKVEVPKPEPVVIPESTRPIQDILKERVAVLPGSIGLKLADDTHQSRNHCACWTGLQRCPIMSVS